MNKFLGFLLLLTSLAILNGQPVYAEDNESPSTDITTQSPNTPESSTETPQSTETKFEYISDTHVKIDGVDAYKDGDTWFVDGSPVTDFDIDQLINDFKKSLEQVPNDVLKPITENKEDKDTSNIPKETQEKDNHKDVPNIPKSITEKEVTKKVTNIPKFSQEKHVNNLDRKILKSTQEKHVDKVNANIPKVSQENRDDKVNAKIPKSVQEKEVTKKVTNIPKSVQATLPKTGDQNQPFILILGVVLVAVGFVGLVIHILRGGHKHG